MPDTLAVTIAKQLEDLEQKISQVAYICYPNYDRILITKSMLGVLGTDSVYDDHIKGYKELGFIKAFYYLLQAEDCFVNGDMVSAIQHIAEGNFDIGDFYGSYYIAKKQRQDAGSGLYKTNHPKKEMAVKYWEDNRSCYEVKGGGGRPKAITDMLEKGVIHGVAEATMRDWLKGE
jgi:hypothetical protein